jgi:predicted nucleic acid-binding protein
MAVLIYLDTSVYNRPFDDQKQPRIWLETLAFSVILQMIKNESVLLITSSVIAYETSRNPDSLRRNWIDKVVKQAKSTQLVNEAIRQRAQDLEKLGIKALDALHVASAEMANVVYFVTCDDRLIKRYQTIQKSMTICSPTGFVRIAQEFDR